MPRNSGKHTGDNSVSTCYPSRREGEAGGQLPGAWDAVPLLVRLVTWFLPKGHRATQEPLWEGDRSEWRDSEARQPGLTTEAPVTERALRWGPP